MKPNDNSQTSTAYNYVAGFVIGLPLVFVPFYPMLNKPLRWGFLVTIATACFILASLRHELFQNIRNLPKLTIVLLLVLLVGSISSTLLARQSFNLKLVGWDTEFLGILSWVGFLIIALTMKKQIGVFVKTRWALGIGSIILVISLLSNYLLIWYGYRLTGLLQQATSMGMYAAIVLLFALWRLLFTPLGMKTQWMLYVISVLAVFEILLSQSRLALSAGAIICFLLAVVYMQDKRQHHVAPLLILIIMLATPVFAQGYFNRLRTEQVAGGFSYRWDVYKASFRDIRTSNYITGYGASGLPETINSRNKAPEGITESLDQGFVFLSAHDIFLDIALSFGALSGICFLVLVIQAGHTMIRQVFTRDYVVISGLFIILLLNGLFNVPSIEMTLLLIVVIIALQPTRKPARTISDSSD